LIEVVVGGVQLENHRGPVPPAVVDDDVHIVLLEELRPHGLDLPFDLRIHLALLLLLTGGLLERIHVVEDVLLHLVEVRADRLVALVFLAQVLEGPVNPVSHHLPVELVDLLPGLPVEATVLLLQVANLLVELVSPPVDVFLLRLRKLLHVLVAQGLAVLHRNNGRPHDRRLQHEALLLCRLLDLPGDLLASLLDGA
jgi:hypothetical protein